MNISERITEALGDNEVLTDSERAVLEDSMKGMNFDVKFKLGSTIINDWSVKLTGIIEFLQHSDRITEDEEEELQMIVNEIEAGRMA